MSTDYPADLYAALHTGNEGDEDFYRTVCLGAERLVELGCRSGRLLSAVELHQADMASFDVGGASTEFWSRSTASIACRISTAFGGRSYRSTSVCVETPNDAPNSSTIVTSSGSTCVGKQDVSTRNCRARSQTSALVAPRPHRLARCSCVHRSRASGGARAHAWCRSSASRSRREAARLRQ